jgi:hypothetical protein
MKGKGLPRGYDHTTDISHLSLAWARVGDAPEVEAFETIAMNEFAHVVQVPEMETDPETGERSPTGNMADGYEIGWTVTAKTQEELIAEVPWQSYTEARKAVVEWINNLTAQIEALYPSAVQKRWSVEEAAARAIAADDGSATQAQIDIMTNEGASKGRTAAEHAAAVIVNADRFHSIANQVNTLFLAVDAQLEVAASPLDYSAIFEWAQAQAAPLAEAYGLEV